MLSVENLTYHYKGRPAVLKDVNFKVNTGEFLAILGNNGVGKSTMLKCFNKILTPDDGKIILDDENLLHAFPLLCQRFNWTGDKVEGIVQRNQSPDAGKNAPVFNAKDGKKDR